MVIEDLDYLEESTNDDPCNVFGGLGIFATAVVEALAQSSNFAFTSTIARTFVLSLTFPSF